MPSPNFLILYVDNPQASARFYASLLDRQPAEESATFAMFALDHGTMLGLWSRHTVEPNAEATGGGSEVAFALKDEAMVDAIFKEWSGRGIGMLQQPTRMDFGYTFVALDPDRHRLRVFAPGET